MPSVHDLSPDLRRTAPQPYSAQIGRPRSAHAGDTVASFAASAVERHAAPLLCRGDCSRTRLGDRQQRKQEKREPPTCASDAEKNFFHPLKILPVSSLFSTAPCYTSANRSLKLLECGSEPRRLCG